MQKVEGSNPFSRSDEKPRFGGAFLVLVLSMAISRVCARRDLQNQVVVVALQVCLPNDRRRSLRKTHLDATFAVPGHLDLAQRMVTLTFGVARIKPGGIGWLRTGFSLHGSTSCG